MYSFSEAQLVGFVSQYFFPMIRLSAFFMAAPIFGTRMISPKVRVLLSLTITIIIVPMLPALPVARELNYQLFIIVIEQVVIGLSLGFLFQVVFQVFVLSGQYIAMKMGLGFASMNDPANGVNVTIVSQFYLLTTTLLFLSVNGHLMLIELLVESFTVIPIASGGLAVENIYRIVESGGWMFGSALVISMPVLTALLVVNIAFGVMSRAAPQMNIFAVGFPITLIFGLLIMWIGFPAFLTSFELIVNEGMLFAMDILKP